MKNKILLFLKWWVLYYLGAELVVFLVFIVPLKLFGGDTVEISDIKLLTNILLYLGAVFSAFGSLSYNNITLWKG